MPDDKTQAALDEITRLVVEKQNQDQALLSGQLKLDRPNLENYEPRFERRTEAEFAKIDPTSATAAQLARAQELRQLAEQSRGFVAQHSNSISYVPDTGGGGGSLEQQYERYQKNVSQSKTEQDKRNAEIQAQIIAGQVNFRAPSKYQISVSALKPTYAYSVGLSENLPIGAGISQLTQTTVSTPSGIPSFVPQTAAEQAITTPEQARTANKQRIAQVRKDVADLQTKGVKSVTIKTADGVSKTVPIGSAYREIVRQSRRGGELVIVPGLSAEARQINIQNASEIKNYVKSAKAEGIKELVVLSNGQRKTVPVESAYREFAIARRTDPNATIFPAGTEFIGPVAPEATFAGSIGSFAQQQTTPPDLFAGLQKGAEKLQRDLGINFGFTPIGLPKITQTQFTERQQGSDIDYLAGAGSYFINFGKEVAAAPEIARRDITQGYGKGTEYFEKEIVPTLETGEGKSQAFKQGQRAGELLTYIAPTGIGKVLGKIKPIIETQIVKRTVVNPIARGVAKETGGPFGILKTKAPKVFEITQGVEPVRTPSTKISKIIEPTLKVEKIGKYVQAKFTKTPSEVKITAMPKQPTATTPTTFVDITKGGVTASVKAKPLPSTPYEVGAIIKTTGTLPKSLQPRLIGMEGTESPVNIYAVRSTPQVLRELETAQKSGYLKKLTDIEIRYTKDVAKFAKTGSPELYRTTLKRPTTIGYYETANIGFEQARGFSLFGTKVGSIGMRTKLRSVGMSVAEESKKAQRGRTREFDFTKDISVRVGAGATGKGQAISKLDENILKKYIPDVVAPKLVKPRQDVFGPIPIVEFGQPSQGLAYTEVGPSILEPQSIRQRRPTSRLERIEVERLTPVIRQKFDFGFGGVTRRKLAQVSKAEEIKTQINRIKPSVIERPKIGAVTIPIIIPIVGQKPKQTPGLKTGQITQPVLTVPEITIPRFPPYEPPPPPPGRTKFGGFDFPIFGGGGTGGIGSRGKYTRKKFIAETVDPLRAGVLAPSGVERLVGYTPKIFRQIDISLGRARKRKGATGGLDQLAPPNIGKGSKRIKIKIPKLRI